MSAWRPNEVNSDSEEEEETTFDIKGREAIIFVVDAFLFQSPAHFKEATNIILDALLSGLIMNDKDLIGIVFANTKESPAPKDAEALKNIVMPENCTLFLPLRQLSKDIVDYYLNFKEENYFNFETTYGVSHGKFATMLRLCGNMFQQCGTKLSTQTIVYFTDMELPHEAGTQEFQKAIQRASDMEGQNIDFSLIPMRDDFNFEPFYKEFLSLVKDIEMDSFEPTDPSFTRQMIANRKWKLNINKRCLGHVNWNLGTDLELSVKIYNYFQKSMYPRKVNLLRDDNSVVIAKMTTYIDEKDPETGDIVSRRELRTGDGVCELACGNESIQVSENEALKIKYPYSPILQLVGFKDQTALRRQHYLRPCSFIYPDEGRIAGSTKLFTAIWLRCLEKGKIAVCVFIPRKKAKPSYVALVPVTAGGKDELNRLTYLNGDGFKVVYLPQAEDLHHYDLKDWDVAVSPSVEGEALLNKIIRKLKVKYVSNRIVDPALSELHSKMLALAFNFNTGDEGLTRSAEQQDERIEQYLDEFVSFFGVEEVTEKRKATSTSSKSGPAKVAKMSPLDLNDAAIDNLIATNKLESLNKDVITDYLKQNNVKFTKSMTKGVLIEKLLELRRTQQ